MYYVIIITVAFLILYLLTLTGSLAGIITGGTHRKIWNTVLLVTFLISATAGIFLALQSNYKWDIGDLDKILNWHVNFGIALSLAGTEILALILIQSTAGYFYRQKTAGGTDSKLIADIYFADLCGAALGFLVIAGILVPLMGIRSTFFILAIINFASYIIPAAIKTVRRYA